KTLPEWVMHAHRSHMHHPFGQGLHPDPLRPQPASLHLVAEGDDPGMAEGDARDVAADVGDDLLTAEPAEIGLDLSAAVVVRVDAQRFDLPILRCVEFCCGSRFLAPHGAPPLGPPARQPPMTIDRAITLEVDTDTTIDSIASYGHRNLFAFDSSSFKPWPPRFVSVRTGRVTS